MTLLISQQLHITFTTMLTKAYGTREESMMYVSEIIGVHLDFVALCIPCANQFSSTCMDSAVVWLCKVDGESMISPQNVNAL